jgi:hypothetical protein
MADMTEIRQVLWKVQLWLDDQLIEEHIAPAELAEQYANVIRLRIRNRPGRRLRCVLAGEPEPPSRPAEGERPAISSRMDWRGGEPELVFAVE